MFGLRRNNSPRRAESSRFQVEELESRALMATGAFVAPDLSPYVAAALHGRNTGPATINRMLTSLSDQLNSGPLAALTAGTDTPTTFTTDVNNLVVGYQASVAQQLSPRFPNITNILTLEGSKVSALVAADAAQLGAGLIDEATFNTQAAQAIGSLTGGPLQPLNTSNAGYAAATKRSRTSSTSCPRRSRRARLPR